VTVQAAYTLSYKVGFPAEINFGAVLCCLFSYLFEILSVVCFLIQFKNLSNRPDLSNLGMV
jgi:hypothetical protein